MSVPTRESGFTLIEVLVALFVFSVLSAATLQALTSTLRAREGVDRGLERIEALAVLDRTLRDDLRHATTRPTRDAFGTPEPVSMELYGPTELLTFTRTGRANPEGAAPRGDLMRVSYDVEDGEFIRRTPALPTPAVNTPVAERALMDGIASLVVEGERAGRPVAQLRLPAGGPLDIDTLTFTFEFETGETLVHTVEVGAAS